MSPLQTGLTLNWFCWNNQNMHRNYSNEHNWCLFECMLTNWSSPWHKTPTTTLLSLLLLFQVFAYSKRRPISILIHGLLIPLTGFTWCLTCMDEIKFPGYGFYYDGERQTSETQKLYYRRFPKPYHRTARDGRIVIGNFDTDKSINCGTFVIDELLFFDHPVTKPEIKMLSK